MAARIEFHKASPGALDALLGLQQFVNQKSGIEASLLHLIELRASQINGCAFCIDMHAAEALKRGETRERLFLLSAWREADGFSPRERAALAWTEAVTLVASTQVPDEVYQQVKSEFSAAEIVGLTMAVIAINSWNRMNVALRTPAGHALAEAGGARSVA
ncbi:MAG: carboxymuconolactone decarboxylase family protein [Terriglobales bacterium]